MSEQHGKELRWRLELLSETDLAVLLDVKSPTLAAWRADKSGPDFVKLGKSVFYRRLDVEDWIKHNIVITNRTKGS